MCMCLCVCLDLTSALSQTPAPRSCPGVSHCGFLLSLRKSKLLPGWRRPSRCGEGLDGTDSCCLAVLVGLSFPHPAWSPGRGDSQAKGTNSQSLSLSSLMSDPGTPRGIPSGLTPPPSSTCSGSPRALPGIRGGAGQDWTGSLALECLFQAPVLGGFPLVSDQESLLEVPSS